MTDGILPTAGDAVSFGGKVWGYPIAVEAVGLVNNTDLVAPPPADFADIPGLTVPDGVIAPIPMVNGKVAPAFLF